MTTPTTKAIQKRSLAFQYAGMNKPIRELAANHGISYSAMYKKLHQPDMQEVIADIGRQIAMRHEDTVLFMQLNGPEYVQQMHNLATTDGQSQMQALQWFLNRLHPIKEETQQVEHKLTGEVAEQFASAMKTIEVKLNQLPAKGSIHSDVHLLSGDAALPKPSSIDAEYATDDPPR